MVVGAWALAAIALALALHPAAGSAELVRGEEPHPALRRYAARIDSVHTTRGNPGRRRALLAEYRNSEKVRSLIERGAIETTEAKAKELRPFVEKLITKAKTGTLHARRLAGRHVQKREIADKLFQEIGPRYATRAGGYTRILKTGHRKGDGAEMARIELIES